MKVGDLVKPKSKWDSNFQKKKSDLGIIVKIEKDFYRHNDYFQDRLTIWWFHGETVAQPTAYVEMINSV